MVVRIFVDKPIAPDELCGQIDAQGEVYTIGTASEEYLGWIDYEEGDVYDEDDILIGWAEDDGTIIAYYQDTEEELEIGFVTEDGQLSYYDEEGEAIYFGRLRNQQKYVEGAAALLLFIDRED